MIPLDDNRTRVFALPLESGDPDELAKALIEMHREHGVTLRAVPLAQVDCLQLAGVAIGILRTVGVGGEIYSSDPMRFRIMTTDFEGKTHVLERELRVFRIVEEKRGLLG